MSEKELERRLSFSHLGGKATGIEDCAAFVMNGSTEFWKLGRDDIAEILRSVSLQLSKRAKEVREEQKATETP